MKKKEPRTLGKRELAEGVVVDDERKSKVVLHSANQTNALCFRTDPDHCPLPRGGLSTAVPGSFFNIKFLKS